MPAHREWLKLETKNTEYYEEEKTNGTPIPNCWERKMMQALWKAVWLFLIKVIVHLSYNPVTPHLDSFLG